MDLIKIISLDIFKRTGKKSAPKPKEVTISVDCRKKCLSCDHSEVPFLGPHCRPGINDLLCKANPLPEKTDRSGKMSHYRNSEFGNGQYFVIDKYARCKDVLFNDCKFSQIK